MSEGPQTIVWTCDRCHVTETLMAHAQPADWCRVYATFPPRRDPTDTEAVRRDLCHECSERLTGYLFPEVTP